MNEFPIQPYNFSLTEQIWRFWHNTPSISREKLAIGNGIQSIHGESSQHGLWSKPRAWHGPGLLVVVGSRWRLGPAEWTSEARPGPGRGWPVLSTRGSEPSRAPAGATKQQTLTKEVETTFQRHFIFSFSFQSSVVFNVSELSRSWWSSLNTFLLTFHLDQVWSIIITVDF